MKITKLSLLVALATVATLSACKPSEIKVTGQVFVAMASGGTVRLGAVEVQLLDRNEVTNFIEQRASFFRSKQASYREALESAENQLTEARNQLAEAQHQYALATADTSYQTNADYLQIKADLDRAKGQEDACIHAADSWRARNAQLQAAAKDAAARATAKLAALQNTGAHAGGGAGSDARRAAAEIQSAQQRDYYASLRLQTTADELFGSTSAGRRRNSGNNIQLRSTKSTPLSKELADWQAFLDSAPQAMKIIADKTTEKHSDVVSLQAKLDALKEVAASQSRKRLDTCKSTLSTSESLVTTAKRDLSRPVSTESFLATFKPTPLQRVNTDADGNFTLSYPRNKPFSLFARGRRTVYASSGGLFQQVEDYCWLVNAPAKPQAARVLLNNNNLVEVDPDGYLMGAPISTARQPALAPIIVH